MFDALEHLEAHANRRQRIAQLMRQRRQEFVLAPVGGRQRLPASACVRSRRGWSRSPILRVPAHRCAPFPPHECSGADRRCGAGCETPGCSSAAHHVLQDASKLPQVLRLDRRAPSLILNHPGGVGGMP